MSFLYLKNKFSDLNMEGILQPPEQGTWETREGGVKSVSLGFSTVLKFNDALISKALFWISSWEIWGFGDQLFVRNHGSSCVQVCNFVFILRRTYQDEKSFLTGHNCLKFSRCSAPYLFSHILRLLSNKSHPQTHAAPSSWLAIWIGLLVNIHWHSLHSPSSHFALGKAFIT